MASNIPEIGIHRNIPFEVYMGWDACSNSQLSDLIQSPAHCKYNREHPKPDTPSTVLGSAVDCAILQSESFRDFYCCSKNCDAQTDRMIGCSRFSTVEASTGKHYCTQHGKGFLSVRRVLSRDDWMLCLCMKEAVHQKQSAKILLDESEDFQLSFVWDDPIAGLCKGRADFVSRKLSTIGDLKTTRDARPEFFQKSIWEYGYHRQAWFYQRGLTKLGEYFQTSAIIAVENEPFHGVQVYEVDIEALYYAQMEMIPAMKLYRECKESGNWPDYEDKIVKVALPPWAPKRIEERLGYNPLIARTL